MKCILCLKIPYESINIFGEEGQRLGINKIISKYFWLEPSQDDHSLNSICPSCWLSLESFNNFYEEIEKAHCLHFKLKPTNEEGDLEKEAESNDCEVDNSNDLLPGIKIELKEELSLERSEVSAIDENKKSEEEFTAKCDEMDFDEDEEESDSEVTLAALSKQLQEEKEGHEKTVDQSINPKDEKIHIFDGKWIATCFGEENTEKPISNKELDKFIKLNMVLTCEICRIPMEDFSTLQTHFKDKHVGKTFVTCCDKKFTLRSRLVDHILKHKLPDYFTCVVCSKVLSCRQNLRKHMIVHDKKYVFQCEKCDKSFYRKQLLDRHMDTHIEERKFKCDECDKLFTSKFSLGQHIYGVHKGGYKKICEQCGKISRDQEAFVRHQYEHANKPIPYVECPKCGIKLIDKNGLRKHLQSQHPEDRREHVCKDCGTVTNTIFALRRHIAFMHKRKRDFKCPMCEKAFKRALTLKVRRFVF